MPHQTHITYTPIYEAIKELISRVAGIEAVLERPKNKEFGHFATPVAFTLAKSRKQAPRTIAQEICATLQESDEFSQVSEVNGYINLTLSPAFLQRHIDSALQSNHISPAKEANPQSILLEYVSANPTGPLHIGHARGAVLGDSLQRLGRYLGHSITSEYYVNDAGAQIYKLGKSIYLAGREQILGAQAYDSTEKSGEKASDMNTNSSKSGAIGEIIDEIYNDNDCYKGEYIIDLAREAIQELGSEIFTHTQSACVESMKSNKTDSKKVESKEARSKNEQEILELESIRTLSEFGKTRMLQEIKANLEMCGIHFDSYVSEKELFARWDSTLDKLKAHQGVYESEGKLWLASSAKGDEKDRVIVREDGEPTYLAGDIIYHSDKFSRDFSHYINIWGADHHGYIARVKASIEYLGYDSSRLLVLLAQMVSLLKDGKPLKMSKRAGNFILMRDVVADIGSDALRFVFLSKKPDTHLEFDVATLSAQDSSNPIFYINYANARIHTLLRKSQLQPHTIATANVKCGLQDLAFEALLLPRVAQMAWEEKSLQKICEYAKSLASGFHAFYNAHKILESSDEAALLKIASLISLALTQSLHLLGIEAKTQM